MAKIPPVNRKSLNQILKNKKNLLKTKTKAAQRATAIKPEQQMAATPAIKNETGDAFIRETARNMLKEMPKYELKIITQNEISSYTPMESMASENSIWAPWSKMFKTK